MKKLRFRWMNVLPGFITNLLPKWFWRKSDSGVHLNVDGYKMMADTMYSAYKSTILRSGRILDICKDGDLVATPNDAGYLADRIDIGGQSMSELIAQLYSIELDEHGSLGERELGPVRIIITRLDDDVFVDP